MKKDRKKKQTKNSTLPQGWTVNYVYDKKYGTNYQLKDGTHPSLKKKRGK